MRKVLMEASLVCGVAFAGLILSSTAGAGAGDGLVAVGLKGGTLGAGVEATIASPIENLNVRGQANGLTLDEDVEENGVNYTGDLKLSSVGAIADYHVGGSAFRISGGAYLNNNKFSLTGEPVAGTIEIGDTVYTAAQAGTVTADVEFAALSPYIGIGFGNALSDGRPFKFSIDIGALYQGDPEANVAATGPIVLTADLEEAERELNAELENLKWYPVVAIGLSYRF